MTESIAALTPTSHLLQAAVDQSFNAVVITNADHSSQGPCITYCNRAFAAMTGYSAEELLGQSPRILQGPLTDPKVIQHLRQCLQNGEFFQGSTFNYRKDGSAYLVEWNISPVRDASGQIQAYVSVQQDITARVHAEQRQALLAKALDATHDAVLIADHQAHILFVNHAFEQQTGYSSAEGWGEHHSFCSRASIRQRFTTSCVLPCSKAAATGTPSPIATKTARCTTPRKPSHPSRMNMEPSHTT